MANMWLICGCCGRNDMFEFTIDNKGHCDEHGNEFPDVFVHCRNCSTLFSLRDFAEYQKT